MKPFFILFLVLSSCLMANAQLYINSPLTIQNSVTLYVDDSVQLASSSAVTTNGILQSTKGINTNGSLINTGITGFIISPVATGINKSFDIGTGSNNKISVLNGSAATVNFKMAVRDNIYLNPQTNTTQITSNAVSKTWYVEPLSNSSNTILGLYWNATDELSSFNRNNCSMGKWQSGTTTAWAFTGATAAAIITGSSPAYAKTSVIGTMNAGAFYFGIGGSGSSLPVKLISFDAIKNNEDVLLNWQTASEINSKYFDLERSLDGTSFSSIAILKAAGNSNTEIKYSYKDKSPFAKLNTSKLFYRLKETDWNGNFNYSEIKNVDLELPDIKTAVFPNPCDGHLIITSSVKKIHTINLYDALGRLVFSKELHEQNENIDISYLSAGVYLASLEMDRKTNYFKLVRR